MADLFIGKLFDSSDEAELFISEYCRQNYHPIRQRHGMTVAAYNKKVSLRGQLPDSIKYQKLNWECKHFGDFKSRGQEKKKIQHVLPKGCDFQITVTYNRMHQRFAVTKVHLEHLNHEISQEMYAMYAEHRKPNVERQADIDDMLNMHANPTLVPNLLHKEGSQIRVKDLYNRKQKLGKSKGTIDESVHCVLSQKIVKDDQNSSHGSSGVVSKASFELKKPNRSQKFNSAMVVMKDLASIIADQPYSEFDETMSAFEKIRSLVICNKPKLLNAGMQRLLDDIQLCGNNDNRSSTPEMENEVKAHADPSIPEHEVDSNVCPSISSAVIFQQQLKPRGRPVRTRARSFKVRGTSPQMENLKNVHIKRVKRE